MISLCVLKFKMIDCSLRILLHFDQRQDGRLWRPHIMRDEVQHFIATAFCLADFEISMMLMIQPINTCLLV